MKLAASSGSPNPGGGLFTPPQRQLVRRLVVALVLVISCYLSLRAWETRSREGSLAEARSGEGSTRAHAVHVVPTIDVEGLCALVSDETSEQRSTLEPEALAAAFEQARRVSDPLFDALDGAQLDFDAGTELLRHPSDNRGRLYRARGVIEEARACGPAGDVAEHVRGRIRLEDGGWAAFALEHEPGGGLLAGDFVRLDGLFLKVLRQEGEMPGHAIEAPLLVGTRAVRSWPRFDPVLELDLLDFAAVEDDHPGAISGQPFEAFWRLVAHARDLPERAVDWNRAMLLDGEILAALALDGARFRARPLRLPPSEILQSWIQDQPENPARVERLCVGWLASPAWVDSTPGWVRFVAPETRLDLRAGTWVIARGFFLKNLAYEPEAGGVAFAPVLVLHSIETSGSGGSALWTTLILVTGGLTLASSLTMVLLLRRGRRRSAELQEELRVRRQGRRRARLFT